MNKFEMPLKQIVGRSRRLGVPTPDGHAACSSVHTVVNLEPRPQAGGQPPRSFRPFMECGHATFHLLKPSQIKLENIMKKVSLLFVLSLLLALTTSVMAYQTNNASDSRKMQSQVASGQKMKLQGTVLKKENDTLTVRDASGSEVNVQIAANTKIEEKKSNPFRGAKKYSSADVIRGLFVEVEGRGDASGNVVADKIKFSNDAQRIAVSINSTVVPVENRVGQAETRLTEAEQNAQRLSGQVEELSQVANLAKGGAAAAQQTADQAVEGVNKTNDRINSLDDYEEKNVATVNFKVGSAVLTPEGKAQLDEVAARAKNEKGYVIEVRGFASSDGSESLNDRLSERRAEAVTRYLAQHEIPLRRIVLPFGYGEAMPVADNTTREGRKQNRRVEVRLMVNRGLTSPVNVDRSVSSQSN
jgi:outer membrane protein OmpA-like peptidoglycan-associated protein/preprotein translocase subunit YajC